MKVLISMALSLIVAAWFSVNRPDNAYFALISSFAIIAFAAPSYWAIAKSKPLRLSILIIIGLYAYAILFETFAIKTGFPYGNFSYGNEMGYQFFGTTPWTVGFAFPPILLIGYYVGQKLHAKKLYLYFSAAITATLVDVVLDPAAVKLGLWNWEKVGNFYGVPLQNFVGWLLAGFLAAVILHSILKNAALSKATSYSGLLILWFWTWCNLFLNQAWPFFIGIILSSVLYYVIELDQATINRWLKRK